MSGIRLHHPTLRASVGKKLTYVVELPTPYLRAYNCPTCSKYHANKAIHLDIDSKGDVIVSPEVLASLAPVFYGGLEVANEIKKPPPQSVGAVGMTKREIVDAPLNKDKKAADAYVPERTKYQSRDRMQKALADALGKKG